MKFKLRDLKTLLKYFYFSFIFRCGSASGRMDCCFCSDLWPHEQTEPFVSFTCCCLSSIGTKSRTRLARRFLSWVSPKNRSAFLGTFDHFNSNFAALFVAGSRLACFTPKKSRLSDSKRLDQKTTAESDEASRHVLMIRRTIYSESVPIFK